MVPYGSQQFAQIIAEAVARFYAPCLPTWGRPDATPSRSKVQAGAIVTRYDPQDLDEAEGGSQHDAGR